MTQPLTSPPVNYQFIVGIDRSDTKLDLCLRSPDGSRIFKTISTQPESMHAWIQDLLEQYPDPGSIAIAFEQPSAFLIGFLAAYQNHIIIYALDPAIPAKFREAFSLSACKDDPSDADYIAEIIACQADRLQPWKAQSDACRRIESLSYVLRRLVDHRTALTNQLTQILKNTFPQALELFDELRRPVVTSFLKRWPTLQDVQRSKPDTLRKFYHAIKVRHQDTIEKRIERLMNAQPLTEDPIALETAYLQIQMLAKEI